MISTSGLSPLAGISLVRENREVFEADIQRDPTSKREIEAFRERISGIQTVDELAEDYQVFSFVMKAFGLEEETYAKAKMKQIMTSDPDDKGSLVKRLSDAKYDSLNEEMGFSADGIAGGNFSDPDWIDSMVERYTDQRLIDTQSEENEHVGLALTFEQKISGMTSWYKVLADEEMNDFFMTAFGLPDTAANASIDARKAMFEKRMPIEDLQKPEVQEKLIRQFSAFADVIKSQETQNAAVTLLSSGSGSFNQVTIDIDMIQGFSASRHL
ncbi:DUF1217 domain-containing protein [Leisingera sp. XS_AS12]|uniref:DUF1217 domain-containing protein n=1 Tax=Leisingera sp. XS_AS12 TaxID=3241294 RepID=UPI0035160E7A